jgi:hypothetical protein
MSEVNDGSPQAPSPEAPQAPKPDAETPPNWFDRTAVLWLVAITTLFCIEMYIYGRNGHIRICVGMEGVTDYTLLDTPRTDAKVSQFPFCAERLNIGMYGASEKVAEEGLNALCGRASTLLRADKTDCIRKENGWTRKVKRENLPPWDKRVYRRLLWLD